MGFVFITPPLQGPDEHAHYVRVQYIANGYFIPVNAANEGVGLPYSIDQVAEKTFYDKDIRGDTNQKYDLRSTKAALGIPYRSDIQSKPVMVAYSPVPYLPAIPLVAIANLLNLSPVVSMYLARLALGITSILLFFLAIRIIPYRKYFLVAVGLIPMILFQQAVITADSVSYALLALFVAYILYLRHSTEGQLKKKQWIYVAILCVGIVLVKPLIFLFLPLILLLVKKKYAIRWIGLITVVCITALVGWMLLVGIATAGTSSVIDTIPNGVDTAQQSQIVKENPKRFLRVMWNSYMTQYGDDETRGLIGVFGAADTIYPLWMVIGYAIILGLFAFAASDKKVHLPKRWKVILIGCMVVYFIAVNYALYTGYTPVNFDIIYGVQGRYFLPIIIVSIVLLTGGIYVAKKDFNRFASKAMVALFIFILLALFITVQRYYLYTP
jgi:uncharacterized membrane protein